MPSGQKMGWTHSTANGPERGEQVLYRNDNAAHKTIVKKNAIVAND